MIELEVTDDAPTIGQKVSEIELPEGSLIISVLRGGTGFVPKADTTIEAGDEVLLVLDPGLEEAITALFAPNGHAAMYRDGPLRRYGASLPVGGGGRGAGGVVESKTRVVPF